jgi:hypothetical protein
MPGVLKHTLSDNTLTIQTPELGPDEAPCRYAYAFKITGAQVLPGPAK